MDALPDFDEPGGDHSSTHRSDAMNSRAVGYELVVFVTQWGLMLLGFGVLTKFVAPLNLLNPSLSLDLYFDAAVKALIALILSVAWLFIWDRQVRLYFHRRAR
jgi:hypothetical protein